MTLKLAMNYSDQILSTLKSTFGFESLRLQQENIIHSVLSGKDTLGVMPTGGGKSLCYQLPAMVMGKLAVVISPLISLMEDQVANLENLGITSAYINSSLDQEERKNVEERLKSGEIKVLFMAPEGILNAYTLVFLRKLNVGLIAIDEAHCVSQWGHEFRFDYTRLNELRTYFPEIPFLALTATADEQTRKDICKQLELKDPQTFISGFDRENIKYMIEERIDEISQLQKFIENSHPDDTGIVYCLSRNKVERVAEKLKSLGFNAHPYHAGMTTSQRSKVQKKFKSQDGIIVVATIAFGMGIDRPDVRFVAHLDLPKSIEGYYQETGRAGRDGEKANAWMIYGFQDVVKHNKMLELTDAEERYKQITRNKLDSMLALCETSICRRKYLLSYFGESLEEDCGNCDTCLNPVETYDGTVDAQKLLSAVYRTGQMYGSGHIIDVLRGSKSAKIMSLKQNELSVYGIGADKSKQEWNSILRQLLNQNFLFIKNYEYRTLALTEEARQVFRGELTLDLRKMRNKSITSKSSKTKTGADISTEHGNEELFENLRSIRKKIAEDKGIPPYMVFADKSLHDMCNLLPQDKSTMLLVHGLGESKYEKFGQEFLAEIIRYQC